MSIPTDHELVLAAREGDEAAFGAIYDRYADRVLGLCLTVVRDRRDAEDALHDTFLTAWQRLGQLREPDRLRPWLFAIARHRAMRLGQRAARLVPSASVEDVSAGGVGSDESTPADPAALGAIVWEAAAGLNDGERAVLELTVRQGLEGDELAAAMGTTRHHVNVIASRMRTSLERSVAALYLARVGDRDCEDLADLLQGWEGTLTPLWRKRIARHADGCERCGETRKRANPFAAFAALPVLAAPAGARDRLLEAIRAHAPAPAIRLDRQGFPRAARSWRPLAGAAAIALVVGVAIGAGVAVLDAPADDEATVRVRTDAPRRSSTTTTTTGAATVVPVDPSGSSTTTTVPGRATTTTTMVAASTTTTAPDVTPPTITSVTLSRTSISRSDCITSPQTITVFVSATDDRGVTGGTVAASTVGVVRSTTALSGSGGSWSATVGPFPAATPTGSLELRVTVRDAAGNTAQDTAFGFLSGSCL